MKLLFWRGVMRVVPYWTGPLWHLAFRYWDEAEGCGCWRES